MIEFRGGEKVILVRRRHWLVFVFAIVRIGVLMLVALTAPLVLKILTPDFFDNYSYAVYLAAALILELLWMVLFLTVADFYLDAWIITDQRLVFTELHGLFNRTSSSVSLANIQDVSVAVSGILATILKFGNVTIQSAGTAGNFVFKQVGNPDKVKELILQTKDNFLRFGTTAKQF